MLSQDDSYMNKKGNQSEYGKSLGISISDVTSQGDANPLTLRVVSEHEYLSHKLYHASSLWRILRSTYGTEPNTSYWL